MKTIMTGVSAFALCLLAANLARAQDAQGQIDVEPGFYLRGSLGLSWSAEDEIDYSPLWGIGVGYRINRNFRVDATIDWRDRYQIEGGQGFTAGGTAVDSNLENRTYMLNLYYDLDRLPVVELPGALKPYIGGGIGIARNELDDETVLVGGTTVAEFTGDDEDQFAWQLMIGAAYHFNENLSADLAYRYADLGEIKATSTAGDVTSDFTTNEIVATLRYRF